MQTDFIALLLASPGISALCGSRINWRKRPQGEAVPAIVLFLISQTGEYVYRGASSLKFARVQCDLYAETYGEALALEKVFVAVVDRYRGKFGNTVFNGIFLDNRREGDDPGKNDAAQLFRVSIDLLIKHKEL